MTASIRTHAALIVAGLLLALPVLAQNDDILPPQEAYQYAVTDTGAAFEVDWAIEDGYYLYRNKLSFESGTDGLTLGATALPEGLHHEDEFFGAQQVYRDRFYVTIPYETSGARPDTAELIIRSQGCADIGICFPPQNWSADVRLLASLAPANDASSNLESPFGSGLGDFLPPDEAFRPYLLALDGNTVELSWQVADGYYLYKDKISASTDSNQVQLGKIDLPAGQPKTDEYFGKTEVYLDDVFAPLPLARATPEPMTLAIDVSYQGCAEDGICYPPITRRLTVELPEASATSALAAATLDDTPMVSEQDRLAGLIGNASMALVIATFFGAGLLLAFTPCVLPMIPILSGIIAGEGDDVSPARGFSLAFSYVMGMALVYTAAGIAAAAIGVQLQAVFNAPWVLGLFAALFVVLALGMFGMYDLQVPSSLQTRLSSVSGQQKSGTLVGAFVMGALSSLIVTACVAPPLVATLTVIGQTGDMLRGGVALFALSLGMGAPLLAVGASAGKLLPKAGPWTVAVKNAFGFMMLGLAIWMLSRVLPGSVTLALWGVLIFMAGAWLGGLTTLGLDANGTQKLAKGSGLLAVIYGAALLLGALSGGHDPLRPLAGFSVAGGGAGVAAEDHGLEFRRVKSVADLEHELELAAAAGRTAMLDFYADWCVSCIEMEKYTFTDPNVQQALDNTVLLQADVTANDATDQALLQHFGVFGPPTIIFFDANGVQRNGYEVVGYMKAARFTQHVQRAVGGPAPLTARTQ